jgi:hypothetical protein
MMNSAKNKASNSILSPDEVHGASASAKSPCYSQQGTCSPAVAGVAKL